MKSVVGLVVLWLAAASPAAALASAALTSAGLAVAGLALVSSRAAADPLQSALLVGPIHPEENPVLADRLRDFLAELRPAALANGVSLATFDRVTADLTPDPTIPPLLVRQPEHVLAPWDYLGRMVSPTRIAEGREMLARHAGILDAVEARYSVDRHVVAAIWGVESNYGALPGDRAVLRSLATLAVADERRPAFWRREMLMALRILERGDIEPARMVGSWAGAMGHTQFMPSSFIAHAVDLDGDGRRDIWQSVPDALGSTANYLARFGWPDGEPWGVEVRLPPGFDYGHSASRRPRPLADWTALGVAPAAGSAWPPGLAAAALLLPTGKDGPAFLVTGGFEALLKYNNAILYALAVGLLADALAGRPPVAAPWPVDDPPLDRAARLELQQLLNASGFDAGPPDGIVGDGTRAAVRTWQTRNGLPPDGWAGTRLLERLRATAGAR